MPSQTTKPNILGKLKQQGAAKAFDGHKADETKLSGGGDLPAGIDAGKAQLIEAKLDEHKEGENKGKIYMMLTGIVVEPQQYAGLRATKIIGLYDGKPGPNQKKQADRIAEALNEMRKMGVDTAGLSLDDWEAALEALKQESPYFWFRTWKGQATKQFPNPRTNLDFRGKCDYTPDGGGTVVDDSAAAATDSAGDGGGDELSTLAAAADGDDEDAKAKLQEFASEVGMSEKEVAKFGTWAEVADAISAKRAESGGETTETTETTDEAPEPWKPKVGEFYSYKPKGARAAIECEVTAVTKETVNLKNTVDGKTIYKGVAWGNDPDTIDGKPI